eukprot:s3074_g11.t1
MADGMYEPFSEESPDFPFAIPFLDEGGGTERMNMDSLMAQVREWLSQELGERMAFYSAQEEEDRPGEVSSPPARRRSALRRSSASHPDGTTTNGPGPPLPKATAAKKPTVASLSAKVDQIMDLLPTLTAQLQAVADQQERQIAASPPRLDPPPERPYTQPAPKTGAPVSSSLTRTPGSPGTLATLLGPPPRTRMVPDAVPSEAVRKLPEDDPPGLGADPTNQPADQYLAALLAQSRALNTLVSHLHTSQTDPLSELQVLKVWESRDQLGGKNSKGN